MTTEKRKRIYFNMFRRENKPLGYWDIEEWELSVEGGPSFNFSCELLLPTNKFILDFGPFFRQEVNILELDPNDGVLRISINRKSEHISTLFVKKNSISDKVLFKGDFNTDYLLVELTTFLLTVVKSFIPTTNKENEYLIGVENKLNNILTVAAASLKRAPLEAVSYRERLPTKQMPERRSRKR